MHTIGLSDEFPPSLRLEIAAEVVVYSAEYDQGWWMLADLLVGEIDGILICVETAEFIVAARDQQFELLIEMHVGVGSKTRKYGLIRRRGQQPVPQCQD